MKNLITKRQMIIGYLNGGDYYRAIKLASCFTRDFTKEQKRVIQIASDCISGHDSLYKQMGISPDNTFMDALYILYKTYIFPTLPEPDTGGWVHPESYRKKRKKRT